VARIGTSEKGARIDFDQADKFGSSIAQALRVQSDSMRTRRRQIAAEKAAKTAVKLIFPLVLFIFPGNSRRGQDRRQYGGNDQQRAKAELHRCIVVIARIGVPTSLERFR